MSSINSAISAKDLAQSQEWEPSKPAKGEFHPMAADAGFQLARIVSPESPEIVSRAPVLCSQAVRRSPP